LEHGQNEIYNTPYLKSKKRSSHRQGSNRMIAAAS
jgi:hypothetical protein